MQINKPLVLKYLQGLATQEEEAVIHDWLSDELSDLTDLREIMAESWNGISAEPAGESLRGQLLTQLGEKLYPKLRRSPRIPALRWYAVAASLLVAGLTVFLLRIKPRSSSAVAVAAVWKTLVNDGTTVKYAVLPDSSMVWLHPHSSLSYALSPDHRSVRLQGEAFFDVRHDERRPFRVYTGDVMTDVLGTSFNVEAYTEEPAVRVSLVQGKVAVEKNILQAGEMLSYDRQMHKVSRMALRIGSMEEWTKGCQVFNDLPVRYALERIAGTYRMKVQYDANVDLSDRRVNTVFKKESLGQMLDILLFISRCNYVIKDDTIFISKKSK